MSKRPVKVRYSVLVQGEVEVSNSQNRLRVTRSRRKKVMFVTLKKM